MRLGRKSLLVGNFRLQQVLSRAQYELSKYSPCRNMGDSFSIVSKETRRGRKSLGGTVQTGNRSTS